MSAGAKAKAKAHAKAAASSRGKTHRHVAAQKLNDMLKDVGDERLFVFCHPSTGRTCEQQVMHDLKCMESGFSAVKFGKRYYQDIRHVYSPPGSILEQACCRGQR